MEHKSITAKVWEHATKVFGYDSDTWRVDAFGSLILWSDFGDRESRFGWVLRRRQIEFTEDVSAAYNYVAVQWDNI